MLIKNCRILIDGKEEITDILIADGKIIEIAPNIVGNVEILDADGKLVIPGIIDAHCHMRDPGLTQKEDFMTGSMACAKGGVTTFIDMPNTVPAVITSKILKDKKNMMVGKSYVDYGFNFGGSRNDNSEEIKKIVDEVASTKIFLNMSTGDMLITENQTIENIFKESKIVSVHAEEEMVAKALELCEKYDKPLYLCHLSKASEAKMLREAKARGLKVFGEVTPHHLFLNEDDVKSSERNTMLLRMKPELKSKEDNEELWRALADGTIDTIGTDHAPHLIEEKLAKLTFGIPGVENSLEMMLRGVDEGKISLKRLIEVMCENPAKIFKIENKGKIEVGYDADLVIVDREDKSPIKDETVISKASWTPYESFNKGGSVFATLLRGQIIYLNKQFYGKYGREIKYYE